MSRVSHCFPCWCFGLHPPLLSRLPVFCGLFSSTPGFSSQLHLPSAPFPKMFADMTGVPWETKSSLTENHCLSVISHVLKTTYWNSCFLQNRFFSSSFCLFLPGEFHGQRGLAGYSLWDHKESDTTERLTLMFILTFLCWILAKKTFKSGELFAGFTLSLDFSET